MPDGHAGTPHDDGAGSHAPRADSPAEAPATNGRVSADVQFAALEGSRLSSFPGAESADQDPSWMLFERGLGILSLVVHEMRGPLMALGVSTEILAEDVDRMDREQIHRMVDGMRGRVLWLQGLLENLLCASAIREGRLHVQRLPVDLAALSSEVGQVVQPLLERRQQRLRVRGDVTDVHLEGDSRLIGQALVNLVLNASKFAPPATIIDLSVRQRQHAVRIAVLDRGMGLPPEGAAPLFAPFYRAATSETAQGIGLGLAVVQSVAMAHGGMVGAHNRRGNGACFWFDLGLTTASGVDPDHPVVPGAA